MGTNEDTADARTALLVRDAMDRATAELPALMDLAGPARAQGRRRKARVRVAVGAGVLAVATLGAVTASMLPGSGRQAPVEVVVAAPPSSSAPPQPLHIEPTPGESSMADLPAAERARQVNFQDQAVDVLQSLLPPTVGTVQRTDLRVNFYRATKDGTAFPLIFSVRPSGEKPQPCQEIRGRVCAKATLPGGIEAHASTIPTGTVTETEVSFRYGTCNVRLSVFPDEAANASAPVTPAQLLDVVKAPAFLDLVKAAEAQPMEQEQRSIPGG
ncbi:hypothetical protein ACFCYM_11150 [Streptomyces sp. NPDC056254]|uniref:hypothetical protein n=1 Tax=Streptomyces sp. NPDC056254 TaxID=3345763 RepID=UPI0035DF5694